VSLKRQQKTSRENMSQRRMSHNRQDGCSDRGDTDRPHRQTQWHCISDRTPASLAVITHSERSGHPQCVGAVYGPARHRHIPGGIIPCDARTPRLDGSAGKTTTTTTTAVPRTRNATLMAAAALVYSIE